MKAKTNPAAARLLSEQIAMIAQTRRNMEKVKREALAIQTENIRTRDLKHSEISKSLEETVNVTGASPLVDVQNVLQQRVLQRQVLETLPTGRGINAYAEATPGIAVATTFQDVHGEFQKS